MKMLRLVIRHWSSWATGSTDELKLPGVPLETLLEVVGEKFVSLRSLKLDRVRKIDDEDLGQPMQVVIFDISWFLQGSF